MFDKAIAIHFRTGGDGSWEDPVVDLPENSHIVIDYAKKVIENSSERICIFFASDSQKLKHEIVERYGDEMNLFTLEIPISHIDRSTGRNRNFESRLSIMENYLISLCDQIYAGKGAYSVVSANRQNRWPWRYFKTH